MILNTYEPVGLELRQLAGIQSDTVWAGRPITYGYIGDVPIVIAACGVGMANAAATTQFLIDRYHPLGVILTGIATPINPAHGIGDIVIADRWITHDFGYWGKAGMQIDSVPLGLVDSVGFLRMLDLPIDATLLRQLGAAADAAAFQLRTVGRRLPEIHKGGVGVSGNAFIDSKPKREELRKKLDAQISDTESAAVVQTAMAVGVPVIVLRTCSAPAGEADTPAAQAQLHDLFRVGAHNLALVVRSLFEREL